MDAALPSMAGCHERHPLASEMSQLTNYSDFPKLAYGRFFSCWLQLIVSNSLQRFTASDELAGECKEFLTSLIDSRAGPKPPIASRRRATLHKTFLRNLESVVSKTRWNHCLLGAKLSFTV